MTTTQNWILTCLGAWLLTVHQAHGLEILVHEDSELKLDFTVRIGDPGEAIYARGTPPLNAITSILAEEHLPLVVVYLYSADHHPSDPTGWDMIAWVECHWTHPDLYPPSPPATVTDPAYDRTIDSVRLLGESKPWCQISPDRESVRFVYGAPDGGSTLLLTVLGFAAVGLTPWGGSIQKTNAWSAEGRRKA